MSLRARLLYTHTHTLAFVSEASQRHRVKQSIVFDSLGMSVYSHSRDNTHCPPFPPGNNAFIYVCLHAYACFGSEHVYVLCVCASCLRFPCFHTEQKYKHTHRPFTWETARSRPPRRLKEADVGADGSSTQDLAVTRKERLLPPADVPRLQRQTDQDVMRLAAYKSRSVNGWFYTLFVSLTLHVLNCCNFRRHGISVLINVQMQRQPFIVNFLQSRKSTFQRLLPSVPENNSQRLFLYLCCDYGVFQQWTWRNFEVGVIKFIT